MGTLKHTSLVQDWEENHKVRCIRAKEWDTQRELFERLYITEDRRLADVRWIMAKRYRFYTRYFRTPAGYKAGKTDFSVAQDNAKQLSRDGDWGNISPKRG